MRNTHTIISECNLIIDFLNFPQNSVIIDKKANNKAGNKILDSNNPSTLLVSRCYIV